MLVKVSFEAPPGVKRNLQRTFEAWGPAFISRALPLQAQLLFMLAWFHAIVQERRTYMPQASPLSHNGCYCLTIPFCQEANYVFTASPLYKHSSRNYEFLKVAPACTTLTIYVRTHTRQSTTIHVLS